MKQITIKEDGVSKSESVDFINTQVAGGSANWMPEDEAQEGVFYVYENGEYVPSDYGFYGFYAVGVMVPGGNGAETIQQGSLTPTYVTPLPATGLGASVIGVDPTDGAMYRTEIQDVDGVPTLVKTKVADSKADYKPTSMKILIKPAKLSYNVGEKIQYAGLVVELLDSTGHTFADERFPQGIISWSPVMNLLHPEYNLITPIEYAEKDGSGTSYETDDGIRATTVRFVNEFEPEALGRNVYFADIGSIGTTSNFGGASVFVADYDPSAKSPLLTRYDNELYYYGDGINSAAGVLLMRIVNGKAGQVAAASGTRNMWSRLSDAAHVTTNDTLPESLIMPTLSTDTPKASGRQSIPVQWNSPYDNQTYEDMFEIEVEDA